MPFTTFPLRPDESRIHTLRLSLIATQHLAIRGRTDKAALSVRTGTASSDGGVAQCQSGRLLIGLLRVGFPSPPPRSGHPCGCLFSYHHLPETKASRNSPKILGYLAIPCQPLANNYLGV